MNNIDASIPQALSAAAAAIECALSGESFDVEDVIAGGRALEMLVRSCAPVPACSLSCLSVVLMNIALDYPDSIPNTKTQEIIFAGYAARLRVIKEFL